MKIKPHHLFIVLAVLTVVNHAAAQTLTNLHSLVSGSDGGNPYGALVLSGSRLYGTANAGGSVGNGSIFAVNTDGTIYTNLHSFAVGDGINPYGGLVLSGNTLYGMANQGGSHSVGTVFAINTDGTIFSNGTIFTNLHSFTSSSDGATPYGGLVLSGNTLYGTTSQGGSHSAGTVFAINTDGTGFTNLYNFTGGSDGANPYCALVLSNNTLYGTTAGSGSGLAPNGTVFVVSTNGTGFTTLHSFTALSGSNTNSDGASPHYGLVLSSNALYGTASSGGSHGNGTVFAINSTGFTNLYNFTALVSSDNSDGSSPNALILSSNLLYGTTAHGGIAGNGTVFVVSTNGGFTNLYSFTALVSSGNSDGANSKAGLIASGNVLYGTAVFGGTGHAGTVFALNLNSSVVTPIPLIIRLAGSAVVLSWANSTFALQSAPVVTGTYTNIPGAATPYTNLISSAQQYFRLMHP
jgi:uncharacterized repeat protein (TIGR03803 family)